MVTPLGPPQRCRTCGAALAPNADWCSLCLTPVAASEPPSASPPGAAEPPRSPAPLPAGSAPGAGAPASVDPDEWAARLAAEEGRAGRPATLDSRSARFAVMVGGAVAVIVVLALGMLVLSRIAG